MLVDFSNIRVSLDAMLPGNEKMLLKEIGRATGLKEIGHFEILKRSIDARKRSNVHFVLTIAVEVPDATSLETLQKRAAKGVNASIHKVREPLRIPDLSEVASRGGYLQPVVVGAGPCGLLCAQYLAKAKLRPIVIERGRQVERRQEDVRQFLETGRLNPNSNMQFGEGGAGTFSDGKLTTGTKSPLIRYVLEQFVEYGAPDDILIDARPHIGTDYLPEVVRNMRKEIESEGGEFRFDTKLIGIETSEAANAGDRSVEAVLVEDLETGIESRIPTHDVVLAIGHSARDTYEAISDIGQSMERKPFAVGVRIEHPQELVNEAQYGTFANHPALGAADYKLAVHNDDGRGVYTFCMCPGGTVVAAASEPNAICVNGMSTHARDGLCSNSALLAEVKPEDLPGDSPFAGIELQRDMERKAYELANEGCEDGYKAPAQTVGDFLEGKSGSESKLVEPTYPRRVSYVSLDECLPDFVSASIKEALPALDRKLHGFAHPEAVLTGVEARSSSPIRMLRDGESLNSVDIEGLYPAGEGAGYAGGIMSSAVDGLRIAQAIAGSLAG